MEDTKKELPENFTNHFNEMKELLMNGNTKSESEFIEKAKKIGMKHFGHEGVIVEVAKKETE